MNKRSIKIPERCSAQIKEMWEDSEGFWAAAAPGWCFDTLSGYLLLAETEEELMAEAGNRIRPEEYEVRAGSPDYTGRLCVIGSGLDEDALKALFQV